MGLLAAIDLTAGVVTEAYVVPAYKNAGFTINICNTSTTETNVTVYLTNGESPTSKNIIEPATALASKGVIERSGIALTGGQKVYALSAVAGTSLTIWGVEE